jgi:hypothetical protein
LGERSLALICKLIPYLNELQLNNIKTYDNKGIMRVLFAKLFKDGSNLMRIKVSNINLNDDFVVDNICNTIAAKYKKFVHYIELSACSFSCHQMSRILEEIRYCHYNIRNLNLSYNPLCLSETQKETEAYKYSKQFVNDLCEYIDAQDILNHLDISGLGLERVDISRICDKIALSNFICSVHLNDNGIKFTDDHQLQPYNFIS